MQLYDVSNSYTLQLVIMITLGRRLLGLLGGVSQESDKVI